MVRDSSHRLQGFITCTTFTNWQSSFRWDSVHDSAFAYDDEKLAQDMVDGRRQFDHDGSLAAGLQSTVRCGDPWNEGIVWPRIAEISLLGGLGCGKALLSLALEKLETMKPSANQNYDYVVLQATENSIPFYESMGFVRVGCITRDEGFEAKKKKKRNLSVASSSSTESEDEPESVTKIEGKSQANALSSPPEIVSSAVITYDVERAGETVTEIAKKLNACPLDIVFLNQYIYKDITQRSYLMKGTKLFVSSEATKRDAISLATGKSDLSKNSDAPHWYIAKENDTPRMIAKKFQVKCDELVAANRERLPELIAISRLKEGTRIKVSHFHIHDDQHVPYCHWTFPDDTFEQNEPSYMMARRLNRCAGINANLKPVEKSLAVPVKKFVRPPNSLYAMVTAPPMSKTPQSKKTPKKIVGEPQKPKRPLSGYILFCNEHRPKVIKSGLSAAALSKILASDWKALSDEEKAPYESRHEIERVKYQKALEKYKKDLDDFYKAHPELSPSDVKSGSGTSNTLFNKVVKLKLGAIPESHKRFTYFYVLTYIPDLQWCHLAPMRNAGKWGDEKPKAEGRPIWMLVDESEGMEVDISASFCIPVASKAMKKTVDADEEQWDIYESGSAEAIVVTTGTVATKKALAPIFTNRASDGIMDKKEEAVEVPMKIQCRSATKPLTGTVERKRKRSSPVDANKDKKMETPSKQVFESISNIRLETRPRGAHRDLPHRKATSGSFDKSHSAPNKAGFQLPKKSGKKDMKTEKTVLKKKAAEALNKASPVKKSNDGESSSKPSAQSPRCRGVYRKLPHRRAAPTFFEDPSPTPKKKPRKDASSPAATSKALDESPRFRGVHRELPPRRAAPTFSFADPTPSPLKKYSSRKSMSTSKPSPVALAESPSFGGVRRELPRRKAAPDFD